MGKLIMPAASAEMLSLPVVLVLLVGMFFDQQISNQEARNQRIQVEIQRL